MHAWCLVYAIFHQSIVMQGNSVGVLYNGLLSELLAILDSFLPVPQEYHKKLHRSGWSGYWEPQSGRESTCCVVTLVL